MNFVLSSEYTDIKSFSFLCWMLRIVWQKISTKSPMAALSDCFPSSSCSLLREYWNLVRSNNNIRVKETKIWVPFKTWCSLCPEMRCLPQRKLKVLMHAWIDKSPISLLYMQMSDLTYISIPCKAHSSLNMKIENALYKFITIISITVFPPLSTSPIVIISLGVITPCSCAVFVSETKNQNKSSNGMKCWFLM